MPEAPAITAAMCAHGVGLSEPRLSPTGDRLAWVAAVGARAELVVLSFDSGVARTVTSDVVPASAPSYGGGAYDWVPDGTALVVAGRDGELWEQPAAGGPARRLTEHGPARRAAAPAVAPSGGAVAYVVDQRDVAVVGRDGRWPVKLSGSADFCLDPAWLDDDRVVWHEWDVPAMPWDESRLVARAADGSGTIEVVHAPAGASVQQARPAPDGGALACVSDEWGWANVTVLAPGLTGAGCGRPAAHRLVAEAHEHAAPTWGHGQRTIAWSPDGARLAFCRNEGGFGRLCVADLATGAVREVGRGVHGNLSWAGGRLAALRSGARTPTEIVTYDTDTWVRRTITVGPVAGFDAADLPEPELLRTPTDDGVEIPARWYPPVGRSSGPVPTIVWVHGGPTDQWAVTFRPRIAYFTARGWGVLVPDHRGSSGHGRAFTQALRGRWGELDVSDCAAATVAAVRSGRADADRLVAMGGSAGGFTVLNLLAHHPRCYAAGVAAYPVADLLELDERTHRYEAHYCHSLVGPLPEAIDAYRRRSPLALADRITTPLLVLHGTDDDVVPIEQTDALVARLQGNGSTVEHHRYEGEGHGWRRPETVIDELGRVEDFVGRFAGRWRP